MPAAPPNKPSASFTSWKLDVLNAASADPRIQPTHFRMFVRVLAAVNEDTRLAILGDDLIADEVPGFAQQSTCNRARRALKDLQWWDYEPGRGNQATRYTINDGPVAAVTARIDQDRERRAAEREARNGAPKKRLSNPASMQAKNKSQPCMDAGLETVPTLQIAPIQPCIHAGSTPSVTPSSPALRHEDMTQGEFPTASADVLDLDPLMMGHCESGCGRDADHVVKFGRHGKWQLRSICAECIPKDYAIQCGDAEVFRLAEQ